MRTGVTVLIILMAEACTCDRVVPVNPVLGVSVAEGAQGYVMTFTNCTSGAPLEVYYVRVSPAVQPEKADQVPPVCQIDFSFAPGVPALTASWQYGTTPKGYTERGTCQALEKNHEYRVDTWQGGVAVFAVRGDGSVEMRQGGCPVRK